MLELPGGRAAPAVGLEEAFREPEDTPRQAGRVVLDFPRPAPVVRGLDRRPDRRLDRPGIRVQESEGRHGLILGPLGPTPGNLTAPGPRCDLEPDRPTGYNRDAAGVATASRLRVAGVQGEGPVLLTPFSDRRPRARLAGRPGPDRPGRLRAGPGPDRPPAGRATPGRPRGPELRQRALSGPAVRPGGRGVREVPQVGPARLRGRRRRRLVRPGQRPALPGQVPGGPPGVRGVRPGSPPTTPTPRPAATGSARRPTSSATCPPPAGTWRPTPPAGPADRRYLQAAWSHLGDVDFRLDDLPAARKAYENALAGNPQGSLANRARLGLGRVLAAQGEAEPALRVLRDLAGRGGPEWSDKAWLEVGRIEAAVGRLGRGRRGVRGRWRRPRPGARSSPRPGSSGPRPWASSTAATRPRPCSGRSPTTPSQPLAAQAADALGASLLARGKAAEALADPRPGARPGSPASPSASTLRYHAAEAVLALGQARRRPGPVPQARRGRPEGPLGRRRPAPGRRHGPRRQGPGDRPAARRRRSPPSSPTARSGPTPG